MNKLWITLLCVFLALLIVGCVVFPNKNMQETIDAIKNDFSPIFTAFGYVSDFVKNVIVPDEVEIQENGVYGGITVTLIEFVESYAPVHLRTLGWYDRYTDQGLFNFNVFSTNLHNEHKVCEIDIDYNSVKYRIWYCAICNEVVGIYKVKAFDLLTTYWIYPVVNSGKITSGLVMNHFDLSFYFAEYMANVQ